MGVLVGVTVFVGVTVGVGVDVTFGVGVGVTLLVQILNDALVNDPAPTIEKS